MKALSLTQPWASLIALGAKTIETRSWRTSYRGPLVIHAAKGFPKWARDTCYEAPFIDALAPLGIGSPDFDVMKDLPRGMYIALVMLVSVERTEDVVPGLRSREAAFGDYGAGRYAWRLTDVTRLAHPIPARGERGLRDVTPELRARVWREAGKALAEASR